MQQYKGWEEFHNKQVEEKLPLFRKDGKIFDVIYAQQFHKSELEELFCIADRIRAISKTRTGMRFLATLLDDKRAMLFFVQPSTRTFLSFQNACHLLGMKTSEIRDASTSSEVKGESPEDMIRTFSSYVDLIIIRHFNEGFAERAAWTLNAHASRAIPVINGGSGKDQHPTQALLDIYTLERSFRDIGGINGKKIAMVGDLKRGRTVRSLCQLLSLYEGVEFFFVAPEEFAMRGDIIESLRNCGNKINLTESFKEIIPHVDAIYATRLQDEYDEKRESAAINYAQFIFKEEYLGLLKKNAVILHPFPRRNEIEVGVDKDPRALYWKQARNGMWVRMALILKIFGREHEVNNFA
jgi:aspartate carbamoyltransferase catalytic subunit